MPTVGRLQNYELSIGQIDSRRPIITDGLIAHFPLDGTVTGEDITKKRNLLDTSQWVIGATGSQGNFIANGSSSENQIIEFENPWKLKDKVWASLANDVGNGADGGWDVSDISIDNTKKYRLSLWIRRENVGDGRTYFGCKNSSVYDIGTTNVQTNPYFGSKIISELSQMTNKWLLWVAYIHPTGYAGGTDSTSGIYDINGNKLTSLVDYRWAAGITVGGHRSFLYDSTSTTERQYLCDPRFELIDGTECTIQEMVCNYRDKIKPTSYSNISYNPDSISVDSGGTNLVSNASFEIDTDANGFSDNWSSFTGGAGDAGRVKTYSRVFNIMENRRYAQRVLIKTTTNASDEALYQNIIGLTAGLTYTFSAYIRSNVSGKVKLAIGWQDSAGDYIGSYIYGSVLDVSGEFKRLVLTSTAPTGTIKANIMVRGIDTPGEWMDVDDVLFINKDYTIGYTDSTRAAGKFAIHKNYIKSTGSLVFDFMPNGYTPSGFTNPIFNIGSGAISLTMQSTAVAGDSRLSFFESAGSTVQYVGNWFPDLNKFYRVVLTWVNNGEAKLYVDGVLKQTVPNCLNWFSYFTTNNTDLGVGSASASTVSVAFAHKNVSLYNKVLSQEEVTKFENPQFKLTKDGVLPLTIIQGPIGLPSDAYHFPLGYDGKDKFGAVSPNSESNIVYEDGFAWVGTAITNLVYDNGVKNWDIVSADATSITLTTISPDRIYRVKRNGSTGSGVTRFTVPLSKLTNGLYYNVSFKYRFISGSVFNVTDWCDTAVTWAKYNKGSYYLMEASGMRATYDSTYRFMDYYLDPDTEIEIWDVQVIQRNNYSPFTIGTRAIGDLEYNLNRDIGLDWSGNWSIVYWKIPIGGNTNNLTSYSIESLGCNGNTVGTGYKWFGKPDASDSVSLQGSTSEPINPSDYFSKPHIVSLVKNGTTLTCKFWGIGGSVLTFTQTVSISAANYFVTQHGYDLKLGGWDTLSVCNTFFRDLIVVKRALSDTELQTMYETRMRVKNNKLLVSGMVYEGFSV